jgi:hypothetical protein
MADYSAGTSITGQSGEQYETKRIGRTVARPDAGRPASAAGALPAEPLMAVFLEQRREASEINSSGAGSSAASTISAAARVDPGMHFSFANGEPGMLEPAKPR